MNIQERLKSSIRDVADFPKPGILFKDISTIMLDAELSADVLNHLVEIYKNKGIEAVDIRAVPAQFDIQTDPQIMVGKNFSESKTLRENNPDAIVFTAGELLVPAQDTNNQLWQVQAVQANGR